MFNALESSLFKKDRETYKKIEERAIQFNVLYNGENIIQDDIFYIMENYTAQQGTPMELLQYPIGDKNLCACTFIRGGRVFVLLNATLPLAKRIFAAAHELYHLCRYFDEEDPDFYQHGSILNAFTIDEAVTEAEEMEANAFAGLLLAPAEQIWRQMRLYKIEAKNIAIEDVLMLMEIFALPYKAMILRLVEENIITARRAEELTNMADVEIERRMELEGRAVRWEQTAEGDIRFGSLFKNMEEVIELDAVSKDRLESDQLRIKDLAKQIKETKCPL